MSTPIELADYQHQLGSVLIGVGTPVTVRAIEGLGQPPKRTSDVEPPGEDGTWIGTDYYAGRLIRIDAAIKESGEAAAVLDKLAELQFESDTPQVRGQGGTTLNLRLKFPGRPSRTVRGRIREFDPDLQTVIHGYSPCDIQSQCADHLYYADELETTSIPLGILSHGGFTAPIVPPFIISGDPLATGRPSFLNVSGNAPTWPLLRVNGPCANPSITHVESGVSITVQTTLADGEWLEIDTRPGWRSALRNNGGGAPLTPASRIDLFQLRPGANEIAWTATDPTLTSTLAVTWWPAFKAL